MSLAHNIIIRSLNAIYLQAPNVTLLADKKDFLIYCQAWADLLHTHHHHEEIFLFPRIEELCGKPGFLYVNVEQHQEFDKGAEEFRKYVSEVTVEKFDGRGLVTLIDGFVGVLNRHLRDEIDTLLKLDAFGGKDGELLTQAWLELDQVIIKELKNPVCQNLCEERELRKWLTRIALKSRTLPFGLGANDTTFEGGTYKFPKFPWFIPILTGWVFWWKYRTVWRFNPCTVWGIPRELEFVKDE